MDVKNVKVVYSQESKALDTVRHKQDEIIKNERELQTENEKAQRVEAERYRKTKKGMDDARTSQRRMADETTRTNRTLDKMTRVMSNLGAQLVAFFAVEKIIQWGTEIKKHAIFLEQLEKRSSIVFKTYKADVEAIGKQTALSLGLSEKQFLNAATAAGDLLVPLGFTRKQASGLSTDLVGLSGALSSWVGGTIKSTEVSEILVKALLGEAEQIKQLGIVVDQSSVQFNNNVKAIMKAEGATLQQAKALAILEQINQKSADAQAAFNEGVENGNTLQQKANALYSESYDLLTELLNPATESATSLNFDFASALHEVVRGLKGFTETDTISGTEKFFALFSVTMSVATGQLLVAEEVIDRVLNAGDELETQREENSQKEAERILKMAREAFEAGSIEEFIDNRTAQMQGLWDKMNLPESQRRDFLANLIEENKMIRDQYKLLSQEQQEAEAEVFKKRQEKLHDLWEEHRKLIGKIERSQLDLDIEAAENQTQAGEAALEGINAIVQGWADAEQAARDYFGTATESWPPLSEADKEAVRQNEEVVAGIKNRTEAQKQQQQAVVEFGHVFGQVANFMGETSELATGFQLAALAAQIIGDQAKALSGAAAASQSVPYPGNLVALATSVGQVLSYIGTAKSIIEKANQPKYKPTKARFFRGVESVDGSGYGNGFDMVPAMLHRNERVITADTNKQFWPTLTAIHNDNIPSSVLNNFVQSYGNGYGPDVNVDNKIETHEIHITEKGIRRFNETATRRVERINQNYEY